LRSAAVIPAGEGSSGIATLTRRNNGETEQKASSLNQKADAPITQGCKVGIGAESHKRIPFQSILTK